MTASSSAARPVTASSTPQEEAAFEDLRRRGEQIYADSILPKLTEADHNKFVAIDVKTGAYAIDADDYTAVAFLETFCPDAELWLMRAGHAAAYRMRSPRLPNTSL